MTRQGAPTRGGSRPGGLARRGAILLEVMLALALFVMAGLAILDLVGGTLEGVNRLRIARQASDLARSGMARLEAGLDTPQTLNGPVHAWGAGLDSEDDSGESPMAGWELEVDTEPSQFRGLTRVTIKAVKHEGGDTVAASYTLRQLVRLSGKGEERAGGEDALAAEARRALPPASAPAGTESREGRR